MTSKTERFDHITHEPLKIFNRVTLMFNLNKDFGKEVAEAYVEQFTQEERVYMYAMGRYIQVHGVDEMRKQVTKNLKVDYDVGVE